MADLEQIERFITKGLMYDARFALSCIKEYEESYFLNHEAGKIFTAVKTYLTTHGDVPKTKEIILNEISRDSREDVENYLDNILSMDFDLVENESYLLEETEKHLKETALRETLVQVVDMVDRGPEVQNLITDACLKSIKTTFHEDFYESMLRDIKRIWDDNDIRISSGFLTLDEYLNGGFAKKTLSVFMAPIHGWKSQTLINMMYRMTLNHKNVLSFTLEMSEDMYKQRLLALMTDMDVNAVFHKRHKREFISRLTSFRKALSREKPGSLYIYEMPTGSASILDIKKAIKEYELRGNSFDVIFIDYLNLMKPAYTKKSDIYVDLKMVSEEVRALAIEYDVPIISVTQYNREGMRQPLEKINMTYVGESLGIPATADFMVVYGGDVEQGQQWKQQKLYKIVKNRLGGRIGEINTFFLDKASLKIYDATERDIWEDHATITGDTRELLK